MSLRGKACVAGVLFATAISSGAQTFTTLAYFPEGTVFVSSLVQGRDGSFYGTSYDQGTGGYGLVFKVTPSGMLTTLYRFCTQANCADGSLSFGALTLGTDGSFYGTTQNGGANGLGVAFKLTPEGAYTVLHSFGGADGSYPDAGLVLASDGNFYGATSSGGSTSCVGYGSGCGAVFRMTSAGTVTTLHSFDGTDGWGPEALVQGTDGSLYGTTYHGGTNVYACGGCGTVFKITTGGEFTSLHSFDFLDGSNPNAPLVQARGEFYGTTFEGGYVAFEGCSSGCGTIFKISSSGAFATVHEFHFGDGGSLESGLLEATDGNLYGESPDEGNGNVISLTLPATVTTVYSFPSEDGSGGYTAPLQATDGEFYGIYGGNYDGVPAVFSLGTGLGPFVAFVIASGRVGQTAEILGQGFTGTSSVTFNGVAAESYSVVSDTYLTAVVPSGATTGAVVVITPGGVLTSNVGFRIGE